MVICQVNQWLVFHTVVFWVMVLCNLVVGYQIAEELTEDGGDVFLPAEAALYQPRKQQRESSQPTAFSFTYGIRLSR
jgi:hypothetical protein